jgi:hypothetical protein
LAWSLYLIVLGALELPNLYTNFKKRFLNFNNLLFTPDIEIALQGFYNESKIRAEKGKLAGWQTLSKAYWSDIAKNIENERPIYEKF